MKTQKKFALVENDPWLQPSASDIENRYFRYLNREELINGNYGSLYDFAGGHHYFGINYDNDRMGWVYREWAPAASALYLTGDFNNWDGYSHPLSRNEYGYWEIFLDEGNYRDRFAHGSKVKVIVEGANGRMARIPAYIRRVIQEEHSRDFTGQLWFPDDFDWDDAGFLPPGNSEMLIYECHTGMAQEKEGLGTYLEFTENILPRVKAAGYNTVQLMAVMEHPYYGSFGYHVSNFFAPSSRFGTPEELKMLINKAHGMGIAVIMDIIHSHSVKNIFEGLNQFDGSDGQYFHPGPRGEHPQWDSKLFDYGHHEVQRFLLSNVRYWMEEFHFDGFRFDGVGSMMYFHHGNITFDHLDKYFREGVEWDAITYLQLATQLIHQMNPRAIAIAEDVTGMPGLCRPIEEGGIGFDFRLGMGIPDFWIKVLKERQDENWNMEEIWHILTDRRPDTGTIAYCESHDQALVGDKTLAFWLMDKEMYYHMHEYDNNLVVDRGIALHKMIRMITIALGGQAYLNFMGNEFGHPEWIDFPREGNNWSYYYCRRQWSLVDNPDLKYKFLAAWDREMLKVISDYKVLAAGYGFRLASDDWHKILVFEKADLLFIFNFHPTMSVPAYETDITGQAIYKIILNSDDSRFGGHQRVNSGVTYPSRYDEVNGKFRLQIYIPNRTVLILSKI